MLYFLFFSHRSWLFLDVVCSRYQTIMYENVIWHDWESKLSFSFSSFLSHSPFCRSLVRMVRYRTWNLSMNNEILSCAENRDTSENARGNKSAATVAKGLLFRFCRGNAKRATLTTLEGWFVPAGYISYFAIFAVAPDGRVYDFAAPFSTVRSLARSRERVTSCTLSLYCENHLGCCFARRGWWWKRQRWWCGMGYYTTTSSATRNYRVPSDVYLIRCDVVYTIAALRIYVCTCVCMYIYI